MKELLKKIFLGITLPQEYLCLCLDEFTNPLKLFISQVPGNAGIEISNKHLFVGYNPLVIAIDSSFITGIKSVDIRKLYLSFRTESHQEIASLHISLLKKIKLIATTCLLFRGIKGKHAFANPIHKLINHILYSSFAEKKKNIYLRGNLYDQVKIAYSIPRKVFLTSVGSSELFNTFPTDISGPLNENVFIISLRKASKSTEQIEKMKSCLVSIMDSSSFQSVYDAGRNHMKEMSVPIQQSIGIEEINSSELKIPVPPGTIRYFELEKIDKFEVGIHIFHFFRILNSVLLSDKKSFLVHIHRDYAEWRIKRGIHTNYLIRKY